MNTRSRVLLILTVLALTFAASSAWAEDAPAQGDAGRVLQKAQSLLQQKKYKRAAAEFERASELAGGSCAECLLGVARAYGRAGHLDSAIQVTRLALPLVSSTEGQARAYDQLGFLLALKGDMGAAQVAFARAVELDAGMQARVRSSLADALQQRTVSDAATDGEPTVEGILLQRKRDLDVIR
jgi:tetratricopeptide (TPR) repeat protein